MLSIFPLLGLTAFEKAPQIRDERLFLYIKAKGITAKGYESGQGFVVLPKSQAVAEEVPSIKQNTSVLRQDLLKQGVLQQQDNHLVFTQDYVFNSPSSASSIILAKSSNGRDDWKSAQGKTLKEIQEAETEDDR